MTPRSETTLILGAGVTGLAAARASGFPVLEAREAPGGICASYRLARDGKSIGDGEGTDAYRFEVGGGHWIFGGDPTVLRLIDSCTPTKSYRRSSAVFLSAEQLLVPYPLQNNLSYLSKEVTRQALKEMLNRPTGPVTTFGDWLEMTFGPTLNELFFGPFHERYTAGLLTSIAPQDQYKSPVDLGLVVQGAMERTPPVGYNVTFRYPAEGLDMLARRLAPDNLVHLGNEVQGLDVGSKVVMLSDGSARKYETLLSTLPLVRTAVMANVVPESEPDPHTSVLVLNIGAERGDRCPDAHWLYIPDSKSGFHRVGFYSNVDASFLPESAKPEEYVSLYVERAFPAGIKPSEQDVVRYTRETLDELRAWRFIQREEVVDPTWIDVAYTWSRPGSSWPKATLRSLRNNDIFSIGRYGRWIFQGIADSIRDGLYAGAALR